MNKACYFCHQNIDIYYGKCNYCSKLYPQIYAVYMSYSLKDDLIYAHIFVNINDNKYHVRLHFEDNYTIMYDLKTSNFNLQISGFPIHINNAIQKLKTYILFS